LQYRTPITDLSDSAFLAWQKCEISAVFELFPNALSPNSREFGVCFGVVQRRCCFLGSYEVFWSDFLPMRCFCVKIDDPFAVDSRVHFCSMVQASLVGLKIK
jgi:hypothetical protein